MLSSAFNFILEKHCRMVTLSRVGGSTVTGFKITPSNYFRKTQAPEDMTVTGREFVVSKKQLDSLTPAWTLQEGDRFTDPDLGTMVVKEIEPMFDFGSNAPIMGFRVRMG